MLSMTQMKAQQSFGLGGFWGVMEHTLSAVNAYEINPAGFSSARDLEISLTYGSEFASRLYGNLYQISAVKSVGRHFLSARYTPGHQKEFIFRTGEAIPAGSAEPFTLESEFIYKELFGIGYAYKITPEFAAGLSVRFFDQEFNRETITTIFSDTVYFNRETESDHSGYWKSDVGMVWKPLSNLEIQIASLNLFTSDNASQNVENDPFIMNTKRGFSIGGSFAPAADLNMNFIYESSSSAQAALFKHFKISGIKAGGGISVFHDNKQEPFIAGIQPGISIISDFVDVSLTYTKYLSNRKSSGSYQEFAVKGISNIINNQFSFDKLSLTVNVKLSTGIDQRVRFLDVDITESIYPVLTEKYLNIPIATALVENISSEKLLIKPAVKISGVNDEMIFSPAVEILAGDTITVKFYSLMPENYSVLNPELTYADFYLVTMNDDYDDKFQKAILVNGKNAWDGNVANLKYFISRDRSFTVNFSKEILSRNKTLLDTIKSALVPFHKAKLLFESSISNMTYVSDPRASSEYVQYPKETIELKGGDCDDLSVCYSALLESVGIETALVDFKAEKGIRHVNIMFNSGLTPEQANLITANDTQYFIRKNESGEDEVWIPVEITSLGDFYSAWSKGAEKFNKDALSDMGLIKGSVVITDVY